MRIVLYTFCQGLSLAAPMKVLVQALVAFAVLFLVDNVGAQDRILLMNGEEIVGKVLGQSTLEVRYVETSKKGRTRERAEPTEDVFSVTDSLGVERIWYFYDTVFGNDMTLEQMRWFIKGEQDARNGYKPLWPMIEAFAVGAGLTIGFNLEMNAMFIPPITAAAMALPRVYITKGSITDPAMEGNEYYATGYGRVGKSKRVVRSLIAGFVGVGVGLFVRQVIINPNQESE